MFLHKIDPATRLFQEDVILDAVPTLDDGTPDPAYIATPCPPGFYWPRWNIAAKAWEEGGTAPEPVKPEPTLEERTQKLESTVDEVVTILEGII